MSRNNASQNNWLLATTAVSLTLVAFGSLWVRNRNEGTDSKSFDENNNNNNNTNNRSSDPPQATKRQPSPKVVRRTQRNQSASNNNNNNINDDDDETKEEPTTLQSKAKAKSKAQRDKNNNAGENKNTSSYASSDSSAPPVLEIQTRAIDTIPEDEEKEDLHSSVHQHRRVLAPNTITIAHGSVTGTCSKLASELLACLKEKNLDHDRHLQMASLEEWDWWDELLNYEEDEDDKDKDKDKPPINNKDNSNKNKNNNNLPVLLVLLPTHHGGSWPHTATCLESALNDLKNDWRIEKRPLHNKIQVAVMGMGCSDYGDDTMGKPAREAFGAFRALGARVFGKQVRVGDDATGNQDRVLQAWIYHDILPKLIRFEDDDDEDAAAEERKEPDVTDMEDLGTIMESSENDNNNGDGDDEDDVGGGVKSSEPREMVTSTQAKSLKKEGYKLIGTHSAVKLCRWTKHQLRGRGGCYKHTFYGITSYQCMEATPSLACANKCVFCWRHHKNPVGKEWRWKTDDPYFIVDQAVKTHVKMIKETRGIPGVNPQRWQEAHTVKHCALSLVGEPVMYPRINELLGDLHHREISTFLVTNGQHPGAIASLIPITQLYVSVDAPTPESLVAIDRPLFSDAWERLQEALTLLKDKGQRTVARLTVVKGWNSDEVEGYARLIALGKVSLVEVKGVTFCGKSDASNLNMSNTPWHHEVVDLVKNLKQELDKLRLAGEDVPEYDLACEHKHSVSVLLARVDQFAETAPDGRRIWKTWINYPRFHELARKHKEDPTFTYGVEDYTAETPAWALFGSEEEGFDPVELRHRRKKKYPKYTQYDARGVPTHDDNNQKLSEEEYARLNQLMDEKIQQVGCGSTVTALKGGEKVIQDASLMFRGLVVVK